MITMSTKLLNFNFSVLVVNNYSYLSLTVLETRHLYINLLTRYFENINLHINLYLPVLETLSVL